MAISGSRPKRREIRIRARGRRRGDEDDHADDNGDDQPAISWRASGDRQISPQC